MKYAGLILFLGACGGGGPSLVAVPDRLGLIGPAHGRTIHLYQRSGAPVSAEDVRASVSDPKVVAVSGTRVRALAAGSAEVVFSHPTGSVSVAVEVGGGVEPFIRSIVGEVRGQGDGYGRDRLPDVILGPPKGGGRYQGSTDVLSLGIGGSITVSFAPLRIYDGPGPDFIVFENPFEIMGTGGMTDAEPGRVAVALGDGPFDEFACDDGAWPFPGCAGVRPVIAGPGAPDVDPTDPERAGGDLFDLEGHIPLADRLRITDAGTGLITPSGTSGFDLCAASIVHAFPDDARALETGAAHLSMKEGAVQPIPRTDLLRTGGATLYGLDAKPALDGEPGPVVLEGDLLRAVHPGAAVLILSAGGLSNRISIDVTP